MRLRPATPRLVSTYRAVRIASLAVGTAVCSPRQVKSRAAALSSLRPEGPDEAFGRDDPLPDESNIRLPELTVASRAETVMNRRPARHPGRAEKIPGPVGRKRTPSPVQQATCGESRLGSGSSQR